MGTFATSNYQTVIGQYNYRTVDNSGDEPIFDAGDYAFIIGNGTISNRSNALAVDWNGGIYINNSFMSVDNLSYTSSRNPFALYLGDKDGNRMGGIAYHVNPEDNEIGIVLQGYRKVNDTNYYNDLRLMLGQNGTNMVRVSSPTAWRKALELQMSTISFSNTPVIGYISNGSKDVTLSVPLNRIPYGTPTVTYLAIALRGGNGQEYLYEASGSNNTTYTQLGTNPVVVWENSRTKRTNGVEAITVTNNSYIGVNINIRFKNTLRKSASTTVAQNNAPYGIMLSVTINFT